MSTSPVVGTLVSGVFGVISGAIAVLFASKGADKPATSPIKINDPLKGVKLTFG